MVPGPVKVERKLSQCVHPFDVGPDIDCVCIAHCVSNKTAAECGRKMWGKGQFLVSCLRIDCNSCRRFEVVLGYSILRLFNVSSRMLAIIRRAFGLSSAGTAYQGA